MIICNPLSSMSLKGLEGIIFDCDGVLFDSRDVNIHFYNRIREYFGLGPLSDNEEEFVHMHSVMDSLRYILPPECLDRLDEVRRQINYNELLPYMRMEEGVPDLLDLLRCKGLRIAINTNRTTTMNLLLQMHGLADFFWPVMTAGQVNRPKPHPESMYRILEMWSTSPGKVAFIGDSVVDQSAAGGAGVPFWAYKNQYLDADMLIPDFWTLREFIAGRL
ncbi:HAD family hydrolase [Desulfonatronospira sp. MSAO_Bac3]|uniref:HAD family hydrolase n=1 Tax=Desulfonatronospira sp. MSAO_Bac3 TaxID=2293857 RepID=UPI000FF13440|nr:HAD family hydrolase [Desulfonatronospira sp. MSAO_Bac3]RQD74258.1 MAG: HAD family hydrolase [Desulfonatronospira sp. MSAO_Bac3]